MPPAKSNIAYVVVEKQTIEDAICTSTSIATLCYVLMEWYPNPAAALSVTWETCSEVNVSIFRLFELN